jgi:hypothetical protein
VLLLQVTPLFRVTTLIQCAVEMLIDCLTDGTRIGTASAGNAAADATRDLREKDIAFLLQERAGRRIRNEALAHI